MAVTDVTEQEGVVAELLEDPGPAQTVLMFLPVPEAAQGPPATEAMASQAQPLAFRGGERGGSSPRLYQVAAVSDGQLPEKLSVRWHGAPAVGPPVGLHLPAVEVVAIECKTEGILLREVDEVWVRGESAALGIRMGLETIDGTLWWEWVTASCEWTGPVCASWRVGGYVPARREHDWEMVTRGRSYAHPDTHRHNWVYCELQLLVFVNGVVRIHARHVNNRFFDRGGALEDVLPVIGLTAGDASEPSGPDEWRRVRGGEIRLGRVKLNLDDAATLSSDEHPAEIRQIDGVLHYRPYAGVEIFGRRHNPAYSRAIGKLVAAGERRIPRGVARTVRMVASLSGAAPRIARYRLPPWHHAACGNLWPGTALPVDGETRDLMEAGARWLRENMLSGCFDDGSVARSRRWRDGNVSESGWEGETPFALFRYYHLTGDGESLGAALRDAYNVADVATDHTDMAVLMHGYGFDARSLPMQRVLGMVAAYLETGDAYLLETAQAVVDNAYWWDRSNWPRRSVGRDAAYVRGLLALADVTDGQHYLNRAREAMRRFAERQLADGAFTDQGGTTGPHGSVNAIVKPWMNSIMAESMVDLLERVDDEVVEAALVRVARWLSAAAFRHDDGTVSWAYKYRHGDNEALPWAPEVVLPVQSRHPRMTSHLLRPLLFATLKTGDPHFVDLCFRNLRLGRRDARMMDQTANKHVEQACWFDSHLFNARWEDGALKLAPAPLPDGQEIRGTIVTPLGPVAVQAGRRGGILKITLPEARDFPVHVEAGGKKVTMRPGERLVRIELGPG